MSFTRAVVGALLVATIACGGGSPGSPSGGGGSGSGGGSNFGTLTAVVDGVAFSGTINAASATNGVLRVSANTSDLTRSIAFAGPGAIGTTTVSGSALSFNFITTTGTTVIGSWAAAGQSGSGTLTVTTLTSSSAVGTFSFSAPPAPLGSGGQATGTRVITSGTFNARF